MIQFNKAETQDKLAKKLAAKPPKKKRRKKKKNDKNNNDANDEIPLIPDFV